AAGRTATLTVAADKAAVSIMVGQPEPGGEVTPPVPVTRKVLGRVTDPSSGEPIVAAQIMVPATGQVIFTEADGTYAIENAPAGSFEIEVSAGEHETRTLQVPPNQTTFD